MVGIYMKKARHSIVLALITVLLVSFVSTNISLAQHTEGSHIELTVFNDGLVYVEYKLTVGNLTVVDVPLIGVPDEELVMLVTDENGTPLAYTINKTDNTISVIALEAKEVTISYYTQTITSKEGETWSLRLTAPLDTKITLPPDSLVTNISPLPALVDASSDKLIFTFNPGNIEIKYTILYPQLGQPAQPAVNQTQSRPEETSPTTQQSQSTRPAGTPRENNELNTIYMIAIIAATVVAIVIILKVRGKRFEELSEVDQEIIKAIEQLGGEAFQSDLQKRVGLPTTTLWRRIKKLERLGYLRVEKRYGRNYVILQ